MTARELYDLLWERLCTSKERHYAVQSRLLSKSSIDDAPAWDSVPPIIDPEGYAEAARDIPYSKGFDSFGLMSLKTPHIKKGTTVRITMVSRFGDMGITPDLAEPHGYIVRMSPDDTFLTNCRLTRVAPETTEVHP